MDGTCNNNMDMDTAGMAAGMTDNDICLLIM